MVQIFKVHIVDLTDCVILNLNFDTTRGSNRINNSFFITQFTRWQLKKCLKYATYITYIAHKLIKNTSN